MACMSQGNEEALLFLYCRLDLVLSVSNYDIASESFKKNPQPYFFTLISKAMY